MFDDFGIDPKKVKINYFKIISNIKAFYIKLC